MKLLIATEFPPDAKGGGPAVVRQMLSPPARLTKIFWWSVNRANAKILEGVTGECWRIADATGFPAGKLSPSRNLTHVKAWLMEHFWAPLAARSFSRAIDRIQPDCIWVIPHDWSILPIHKVLVDKVGSKNTNIERRRFHTTIQDYPDAHGHSLLWGNAICDRLNRMQDDLYRLATSRDATSIPMPVSYTHLTLPTNREV